MKLTEIRFAELKEDIEEQKEFHKKGLERIRKYYSLPENEREEKTGLKDPPHEILMKRASNLISLGLESLEKRQYIDEEPIDYILIGVGTELLLKAIILKEDPEWFIGEIEKNKDKEKTPPFKKCSEKLTKLLPATFTQKQKERIKDVFDLIRQKRNNLVHIGFHQMYHYREDYQIAHVLEFLFSYFFGRKAEKIVEILKKFKEKRKVVSGIDYEDVEFLEGEMPEEKEGKVRE